MQLNECASNLIEVHPVVDLVEWPECFSNEGVTYDSRIDREGRRDGGIEREFT